MDNLETMIRHYRVDRRQISFLKFIIEAYDGIAVLTTIDPASGIVAIRVAPGCGKEVDEVLDALKSDLLIEDLLIENGIV